LAIIRAKTTLVLGIAAPVTRNRIPNRRAAQPYELFAEL
jgi:hypothetical protein